MKRRSENSKVKDVQLHGLEILAEFHKICELNQLKYILDYGTLLGAVRHKGFIPWDDDVDVAMPRIDFKKFEKIAKDSLPENMFLQTHKSDKNYYLTLAKIRIPNKKYTEKAMEHLDIVHGPWIDIFIYDYKYDEKEVEHKKQELFNQGRKFYPFIMPTTASETLPNRSLLKEMIKKLVRFMLGKSQMKKNRGLIMRYIDYKYNKIDSLIENAPVNNGSGDMMTYAFNIDLKNPEKRQTLNIEHFEKRKLQKFEDHFFYIPINYEQILIDRYGDYNALPPKDERNPSHVWAD